MIYPGIDVYIDVEKKYPQTWKSMHPLRWRQNNDTAQSGNQIRQWRSKTFWDADGVWFLLENDLQMAKMFQIYFRLYTGK